MRHSTGGRSLTIIAAAALFVAVFFLRMADSSAADAEGILFVVPIAVLALGFGLRGGVSGGLLSCALIVLWGSLEAGAQLPVAGYLNRAVAYMLLGVLLGAFVDKRSRLEAATISSHDTAERQLAENAKALEVMIAERTGELDAARSEMLRRLAIAAEYRDDETFQHTERVGEISARIGTELGFSLAQVRILRDAAPLHDVGKLAIPDRILLKPGRLTPEEYAVMQTHTTRGAHLLSASSSPVLQRASAIALNHHERWDGAGYPRGLTGEAIPLAGRIVAVADVFDALTHERPYKQAWSTERAIAEIRLGARSQFDPAVVAAFLKVCEDPQFRTLCGRRKPRQLPGELARSRDPMLVHLDLHAPRARPGAGRSLAVASAH